MPYCKACEEPVGDPQKELHDPDNLAGILPEGANNPDEHHIAAKDGPKGVRLFCSRTGQTTSIEEGSPPDGSGTGSGKEPKDSPKPSGKPDEVYDLPDEKSAMDILEEVVGTPVFGLDQEQIQEVLSWGDIYDGQVPPDQVENLLKNLSGVSNQKASLMRQKYEAKLNKWIQKKSLESGGPSVGAAPSPPMPGSGNPQVTPQQPQSGNEAPPEGRPKPPQPEPPQSGMGMGGVGSDDLKEERRKRRIERRNDAMDVAAERFADEFTRNMAHDFGGFFGDLRDVAHTAFKKKAEKDPDWFFEKMEKWDMDILDAVLEPSDARKEEMESSGGGEGSDFGADMEIDAALEDMEMGSDSGEPEESPERTNKGDPEGTDAHPMSASPEDFSDVDGEDDGGEESAFDEIMGEATE